MKIILFSLVGALGVAVHLFALRVALEAFSMPFAKAQMFATVAAMTSNFIMNNHVTYHDQRLSGLALVRGLMGFYLVCGIGVVANVGVALLVFDQNQRWWLAGIAGAVMGAIWNYAMSSLIVWNRK